MPTNENQDNRVVVERASGPSRMEVILCVTAVVALLACAGLAWYSHKLSNDMNLMQENTRAQIAKLSDQMLQNADEANQRAESISKASRDSAESLQEMARNELKKTNATLAAKISADREAAAAAQKQVSADLDELKQANSSTANRIDTISTDVTGVKGDVASTQSEVQATGAELKRVTGDMGVMSGLIATNGKDLQALRDLGERNYVEFDIKRSSGMQKVGNIQMALAKVDPKRNRYTVDVLADDKKVEKRDRTINEPVQLYVAGSRQPVEIVVNQVKKDEVVGYIAIPKVKAARP